MLQVNVKDLPTEAIGLKLVEMNSIMKDLEETYDYYITELKTRGLKEAIYFPNFEMKVSPTDGKASSDYDVVEIHNEMAKEGMNILMQFPKIVKINKKQAEELEPVEVRNTVLSILLKNVKVTPGTPSISVSKMNLKEQKEHPKEVI